MDVSTLIAEMTLAEKVGQLFSLAFARNNLNEASILIKDHVACGCYLSNDNIPSAAAALGLSRELQGLAQQTRLQLPLLLSPDQEGTWAVMAEDSCPGPGNLALGASHQPDNAYRMYNAIGQELRAVGLNAPFCPCADCNTSPVNAIIGMRSFGERAELVADMTAAAVKGLKDAGVLASLKHFPGHGDTQQDSHRDLPKVDRSRQDLFDIDLFPFAAGIRAGADIVMTAHIIFSALDAEHPATLSKIILQDILRGTLGFEGLIVSDSMNMKAMKRHYQPAEAEIKAINAGVDVIMLAEEHYDHDEDSYLGTQLNLIKAVQQAVRNGVIPIERVNDALERILKLKMSLPEERLDLTRVGTTAHRELERSVALDAVALLRNSTELLPLSRQQSLTVINCTKAASYQVLGEIRGVGPNQTTSAFAYFVEALRAYTQNLSIVTAEDYSDAETLDGPSEDIVIAVSENHTLPGMDFDQDGQAEIIKNLLASAGPRLIVVALRDPYELANFPEVPVYLCSFSFRPCAAQAAVEVLFGQAEAKGRSPVSIPGAGIKA